MSDLDVIRKIERDTGVKLDRIPLSEYNENMYSTHNGYSVGENNQIIALYLDKIFNLKIDEILSLNNLNVISLKHTFLNNYSFLAELKHLKSLNIANNDLKYIDWLKNFKYLEVLDISHNNITNANILKQLDNLTNLNLYSNFINDTKFLTRLDKLTYLNISANQITDILPICKLLKLEILDLSWNKNIKNYMDLKNLVNLKTLDLYSNNIEDIDFLEALSELTYLDLRKNKLENISVLEKLSNLKELALGENPLVSDYQPIAKLKGLKYLNLNYNQINDTEFLENLSCLESLDLMRCNLNDISFLSDMENLHLINLHENYKIETPPKEIIDQGIEAIRSYFKSKEKQGVDYLYEAKVLFVGEPDSGKTSLMNKLIDPNHPVPNLTSTNIIESTLGIDVKSWRFEYTDKNTNEFTVNFWDFGGQNIQYYIHQFFLTEDSLYVLVVDDRRDLENIDYWFQIIALLGKGSPVLLIRNEKKINSSTLFDSHKYLKRYGKILDIDFRDLNLARSDGRLEVISSLIRNKITSLSHIGNELPSGWVKIVEKLRSIKDSGNNYILVEKFQEICTDFGVAEATDQFVLCGYLRALGKIVYFKDDTGLSDTLFLNPQWIIDAVYSILSSKFLEKHNGRFSRDWLVNNWGDAYSISEKDKILLLMQKPEFDLCYKISRMLEESYLAPQLLPDVAPKQANDWNDKGSIAFRFLYSFMPKGIIPRIIVRLNSFISEDEDKNPLAWRSGVILEKERCQAIVKEDLTFDNRKVIDIFLRGDAKDQNSLLEFIRYTIIDIHRQSFPDLIVKELLPCYCEKCINSTEPTFFNEDIFNNAITAKQKLIQCHNSFKYIEIDRLLRRVITQYDYDIGNMHEFMSNYDFKPSHDQKFNLILESLRNLSDERENSQGNSTIKYFSAIKNSNIDNKNESLYEKFNQIEQENIEKRKERKWNINHKKVAILGIIISAIVALYLAFVKPAIESSRERNTSQLLIQNHIQKPVEPSDETNNLP